jgi:hypothetical protein
MHLLLWEKGRLLGLGGSDWAFLAGGIALTGVITFLFSIPA